MCKSSSQADYRHSKSVIKHIFGCSQVENGNVKCIKDEIITSSAIEVRGSDMQ